MTDSRLPPCSTVANTALRSRDAATLIVGRHARIVPQVSRPFFPARRRVVLAHENTSCRSGRLGMPTACPWDAYAGRYTCAASRAQENAHGLSVGSLPSTLESGVSAATNVKLPRGSRGHLGRATGRRPRGSSEREAPHWASRGHPRTAQSTAGPSGPAWLGRAIRRWNAIDRNNPMHGSGVCVQQDPAELAALAIAIDGDPVATEAEITSRFRREGKLSARRAPAGIGGHHDHRRSPAGHSQATTCHKADREARGRLARGSYTRSGEVVS